MSNKRSLVRLTAGAAVVLATIFSNLARAEPAAPLSAESSAAPKPPADAFAPNYFAAMVGTTLAYRAPHRAFAGTQGDVSPMIGYGRFLTKTIAVELDLGPTVIGGALTSFTLMPGVVWAFHPNVYGAARFLVPVHPQVNLGVAPGIGFTYTFAGGIAPFAEFNAVSMVARGAPDLGVAASLGAVYGF